MSNKSPEAFASPSNDLPLPAKSTRISVSENIFKPSRDDANDSVSACSKVAASPGSQLLAALWRSPDRAHQCGVFNRRTKKFRNIPVIDVNDAVARAQELSNHGVETYFACAEYLTRHSREAGNVSGAWCFWLDIDCGDAKIASGNGYQTVQAAEDAVFQFCRNGGLPNATHLVSSGGGLHVYWALSGCVDRLSWQAYARKLKRVTHALKLFADDTRTADIASVLRVPGTLNHKYDPPRPVTLQFASGTLIERATMLEAIDCAHKHLCSAPPTRPALCRESDPTRTSISGPDATTYGPPDIERLASALVRLTPDCDDVTWKLRRVAPMANAARQYPNFAVALYRLARSWSSGELTGIASIAWCNPGNNGRTGEEVFDEVWNRFLTTNYAGKPVTLGTIFHDAMAAGWDGCAERFDVVAYEIVREA